VTDGSKPAAAEDDLSEPAAAEGDGSEPAAAEGDGSEPAAAEGGDFRPAAVRDRGDFLRAGVDGSDDGGDSSPTPAGGDGDGSASPVTGGGDDCSPAETAGCGFAGAPCEEVSGDLGSVLTEERDASAADPPPAARSGVDGPVVAADPADAGGRTGAASPRTMRRRRGTRSLTARSAPWSVGR